MLISIIAGLKTAYDIYKVFRNPSFSKDALAISKLYRAGYIKLNKSDLAAGIWCYNLEKRIRLINIKVM